MESPRKYPVLDSGDRTAGCKSSSSAHQPRLMGTEVINNIGLSDSSNCRKRILTNAPCFSNPLSRPQNPSPSPHFPGSSPDYNSPLSEWLLTCSKIDNLSISSMSCTDPELASLLPFYMIAQPRTCLPLFTSTSPPFERDQEALHFSRRRIAREVVSFLDSGSF